MLRIGVALLGAALTGATMHAASAALVTALVTQENGDVGRVADFEVVMVPQALLIKPKIDRQRVTLYCSRSWSGVLVKIDDQVLALNEAAIASIEHGLEIDESGATLPVTPHTDSESPLKEFKEVAAKLTERANSQCNPEPTATAGSGPAPRYEQGRKLYALVEAATEYCPSIEDRWGAYSTIKEAFGYSPPTTDDEIKRMSAEKDAWFSLFRQTNRSATCDQIMQDFGPGGTPELLQFE